MRMNLRASLAALAWLSVSLPASMAVGAQQDAGDAKPPAEAGAAPAAQPQPPAATPAPAATVPASTTPVPTGPAAPALMMPGLAVPGLTDAGSDAASSLTNFTVGDIKIEGLQRISEGTVYNYLPVNIGDQMNAQRLREALRALYATGFFRDVVLSRDGNTLLITVLERPSLESVEIKGNKDIKTEDLQKSLNKFKVPEKEQSDLLAVLGPMKPAIVGQ